MTAIEDMDLIDQELYDTLQYEVMRGRRSKPPESMLYERPVDRGDPRWKRLYGSLGEFAGIPWTEEDKQDYCDRVYRLIPR